MGLGGGNGGRYFVRRGLFLVGVLGCLVAMLLLGEVANGAPPERPKVLEKTREGEWVLERGGIFSPKELPRVENFTYNLAEGSLMGTLYRMPLINADFDRPIYLLGADRWCVGCSEKKKDCKPCDYSRKGRGGCSKEAREAEARVNLNEDEDEDEDDSCLCRPSLFCETDPKLNEFDEDYKVYEREWIELELGKKRDVVFQPPSQLIYRVYAPDPCHYLRILVDVNQAYTSVVEVANEKMWKQGLLQQRKKNRAKGLKKNFISNPFMDVSLIGDYPPSSDYFVCPNDEDQLFQPGTYFIRVKVDSLFVPWFKYTILVEAIPTTEEREPDGDCAYGTYGTYGTNDTYGTSGTYGTYGSYGYGSDGSYDGSYGGYGYYGGYDTTCLNDGEWKDLPEAEPYGHYSITVPKASSGRDGSPCPEVLIGSLQTTCGFIVSPVDSAIKVPMRAFSVCLSPETERTFTFSVTSAYYWNGIDGAPPGCTPRIVFTTSTRFRLTDPSRGSNHYYYQAGWTAAALRCGNPLSIVPDPEVWDPGYYTWSVIPDEDPNPFWPFPAITYFLAAVTVPNATYLDQPPYHPRPNRFSYAILESYEAFTDSNELLSLSEKEFRTCQLSFPGAFITNIDGTPVDAAGPPSHLRKEDLECDPESFRKVNSEMRSLLKRFDRTTSGTELARITVTIDNLSFSKYYLACWDLATSLLQEVGNQSVVVLNSTACVAKNEDRYSDPCCDFRVGWDGDCCIPRTVNTEEKIFQGSKKTIEALCDNPECSLSLSVDMELQLKKVTSKAFGCANPFTRVGPTPDYTHFMNCRDRYFGANQTVGLACNADNECVGKCNLVTGFCLNPIEKQEYKFLECLREGLAPFTVNFLNDKYDIKSKDPRSKKFLDGLRRAFTVHDCVSETELGLPFRNHWKHTFACDPSVCPGVASLDGYPNLPFACVNCFMYYDQPTGPREWHCQESLVCNWMNCSDLGYSQRKCEKKCLDPRKSEFFCGLCENDLECIEFPDITTEKECREKVACVIGGEVSIASDASSCSRKGECDAPCYKLKNDKLKTRRCKTKECEGSGVCGEALQFLSPRGSCIVPEAPYFYDASCDVAATPLGCLYPDAEQNTTACEEAGGSFYFPAETQDECLAYGYGCLEENPGIATYLRDRYIITRKPENECRRCGGQVVPLVPWRKARWNPAQSRQLQWKRRDVAQKFKYQETLDFPQIMDDLILAHNLFIGSQYRSWAQCRYSNVLELIEAFACDCTSSDGDMSCFSNFKASVPSGFQTICPGQTAVLVVPPSTTTFYPDSIPDPYSTGCVDVEVNSISSQPFEQPQEQSPSAYLIAKDENPDTFSFFNSYQAVVGQVVGEGIEFKFSSTFPGSSSSPDISHFELCVSIETDDSFRKKYPIRDLAVTGNDPQELIPQQLDLVQIENGLYCARVDNPIEGVTYYPIIRIEDWEGEVPFSSAEIAMMYFAGAVYSLIFVCALGLLVDILAILKIPIRRTLVQTQVVLLCLIRALYFFLMATQQLTTAPTIVVILLAESPGFFYFTAFTFLILLWMMVNHVEMRGVKSMGRHIFKVVSLVNFIFLALLVGLILLFELLPDSDPSTCGGRAFDPLPEWPVKRILNVVYRILLASLSTMLAVLVFYTEIRNRLFARNQPSSTAPTTQTMAQKNQTKSQKIVSRLTMASAAGILIQSAYLVFLGASDIQNNIATISILLITEVFVSILLIQQLYPRTTPLDRFTSSRRKTSQSHSGTRTGTGTGTGSRSNNRSRSSESSS